MSVILSILDGKPMGELMNEIIKWKNRNYLTVTSVSLYFRLYLSFVIGITNIILSLRSPPVNYIVM